MADMYITVGVDTTKASYEQFQKDLNTLVSQIQPPVIRVKLEIDNTAVENLRRQLTELNTLWASSGGATSTKKNTDVLTIGTKQYFDALKRVSTLQNTIQSNTAKWSAAATGKTAADFNTYKNLNKDLEDLNRSILTGRLSNIDYKRSISQIESTAVTAGAAIKSAGKNTQSWAERIGKLSAKFGTWFSITRVIMAIYRTISKMITNVIELDTAMTELKKVTNESDATYEKFLINATSRAKKLGAALKDTVNATADFARLGYGIEDAEKLADAAIVYKNVGDGIEDIGDASESIIATMQAFDIPAERVMTIVDRFNKVGNNFAISSKGVGDALLRSAAALHSANNTIDESIALATAANTIVQDPEKVGTTLKTVSMYLRAAKTEAEEAGESTDGMANSVSELRGDLLKLTGNKVDIQLDENTFKSTYQILKELSVVWDELTDLTQANILEMIGGKRNSNVVSALLEDFSIAEEVLSVSKNSSGSALAENDKVLESIQGRLNVLKATFEELSKNFFEENLIKDVVDLGTGLLNVLNFVVELTGAFGGLNTLLYATVAILAIIKADLIKGAIIGGFTKLIGTIKSITLFFGKLKSAMTVYRLMTIQVKNANAGAIVTYGQSTGALGRLSAAFKAVGISASTAQIAMGIFVAAATVLIGTISMISNANKEAADRAEENAIKLKEEADAAADKKKSFDDLIKQYKLLAEESNGVWSLEQAEEVKNIQSQIVDLVGMQADNIDLVNGKLDNEYDKLLGIQKVLTEDEYNTAYSNYISTQEKLANGYEPERDFWGNTHDNLEGWYITKAYKQIYDVDDSEANKWWGSEVGYNGEWLGSIDDALYEIGSYEDGLKKLKEWRDLILKAESEGFGYYNSSGTWVEYDTGDALAYINSKIAEFESVVSEAEIAKDNFFSAKANREVLDYLTVHTISNQSQLDTWLNSIIKSVESGEYSEEYAKVLVDSIQKFLPDLTIPDSVKKSFIANIEELKSEILEAIPSADDSQIQEWLEGLDSTRFEAFVNWWKDNSDSSVVTSGFNSMLDAFESYEKRMAIVTKVNENASLSLNVLKDASDAISSLSDASEEFQENGYVTIDTLLSIKEATGLGADEWGVYQEKLLSAKIGSEEFYEILDDLTYKTLQNKFATIGLENATEQQIEAVLREQGVVNSSQKASEYYKRAKIEAARKTGDFTNVTYEECEALVNEIYTAGAAEIALRQIALQKQLLNDNSINTASDVENLIAAANAANLTTASYQRLLKAKEYLEYAESGVYTHGRDMDGSWTISPQDWRDRAERLLSQPLEWEEFNPNDFIAGVVQYRNPTTGSNTGANSELKAYLEGSEWSYKAHQNELKYINDLEWALNNLAKTDEERFDILNDIEQARKDYADNRVKDIEHEIEMTKYLQGEEANVIDFYKEIQTVAHDEANRLRSLGYTDQSDEIQEWQKTWWDAEEKIREEAVKPFDNVVKHSENAISVHEIHLENAINSGDHEGVKQYSSAAVEEYRKAQEAIHQKAEYYRSLGLEETSDEISELSTMWWDYEDKITEIIIDSYQTLVDNAKSALEEVEGIYESLISAADEYAQSGSVSTDIIKELADIGIEYVSLLKDENGQLVINKEKVDEVIKAKTQQLAIESALNYIYQIQLALEQGKTDEVARLIDTTVVATGATWDLVYATAALTNVSDEQYQKMISNINVWRSIAENSSTGVFAKDYEGQKDALDTILDLTMELIRYEAEQEIEALDQQIEKYQSIIELKKESLEETKEENDYNKEVAKKVSEIADIQSRINQLALDDSREAAAERRALEEELAEKSNDLTDYQADYAHDKQTEMLDEELEDFEKEKEKEKEIIEDSVSSTEKVYQLAIDRIENDWDGLYYDIINWNYEAGSSIESEIVSAWQLASDAVQEYGSFVDAVGHFDSIETNADNSNNVTLGTTQDVVYDTQAADRNRTIRGIVTQMKANSDEWLNDTSTYQRGYLEYQNMTLAERLANEFGLNVWKDESGAWRLNNDYLYPAYGVYHTGGIVGRKGTVKDNEVLSLLENGEMVLDQPKKESMYRLVDISTYMMEKFGAAVGNVNGVFASTPKLLSSEVAALTRDSTGVLQTITGKNPTYIIESLEVNTPIQVLQKLDEASIKEYSKTIGAISAQYIKEGFTKRGIK